MENSVEVLQKAENKATSAPAISLLSMYPEKIMVRKDPCTSVFTAALFTIAKTWKQPRCPLADEWIRMQQYIYSTEYYSAIKKNAFKYTEFRKMIITLYIRQQKRHRCEEQTFGLCGRR